MWVMRKINVQGAQDRRFSGVMEVGRGGKELFRYNIGLPGTFSIRK